MYEIYAELRDKKGVTDYRIAKDTGIDPATLTHWKQGVYAPKLDKLLKISNYFGVPITVFIKEEEK